MLNIIMTKMPIRLLFTVGLGGYLVKTLDYDPNLGWQKGILDNLLDNLINLTGKMGLETRQVQFQVYRSQNRLRSISPTKLYHHQLDIYQISTAKLESELVNFYRSIFRYHPGVTSSYLDNSEGKTTTMLQVLSEFEQVIDRNRLFLYLNVSGQSLSKNFRRTLKIHPDISVTNILEQITIDPFNPDHYYTIMGCVDQVENLTEKDRRLLNNLVHQQYTKLRIHFPCAKLKVALAMDQVDLMRKARFVDEYSSSYHWLNQSQAIKFVQTFCLDGLKINHILTKASQLSELERHNTGFVYKLARLLGYQYFCPKVLVESFQQMV